MKKLLPLDCKFHRYFFVCDFHEKKVSAGSTPGERSSAGTENMIKLMLHIINFTTPADDLSPGVEPADAFFQ